MFPYKRIFKVVCSNTLCSHSVKNTKVFSVVCPVVVCAHQRCPNPSKAKAPKWIPAPWDFSWDGVGRTVFWKPATVNKKLQLKKKKKVLKYFSTFFKGFYLSRFSIIFKCSKNRSLKMGSGTLGSEKGFFSKSVAVNTKWQSDVLDSWGLKTFQHNLFHQSMIHW